MRRGAVAALVGILALAAPSRAEGEGLSASEVYLRRRLDMPGLVAWLRSEARRIDAKQVLVVFDAATFAPPPGHTEFTSQYGFFRDVDPWLSAFEGWGSDRGGVALRGTSTIAQRTVPIGEPGWKEDLAELVRRPWWKDEDLSRIEPAASWVGGLLARTRLPGGETVEPPKQMLVLVTGPLTPERWVPETREGKGHESEWRTKLLPVGDYWDPEAVGRILLEHGSRLYAVAPEAKFGDTTPMVEAPDVPWAARPQYPSIGRQSWGGDRPAPPTTGGARPGPGGRSPPGGPPRPPGGDRPAGGSTPPTVSTPSSSSGGGRYVPTTPRFFERHGSVALSTDDAPSGYGPWPIARVVARTRGKLAFYPFAGGRWLDACPADPVLLDRLAPELVPPARWTTLRGRDRVLDRLCRAAELVVEETPWADTAGDHRAATAWSAFARTTPLVLHPDSFLRRRPFDAPSLHGSEDDVRRAGERLARDVLPRYDEAIAALDEAIAEVEQGRIEHPNPRSVAHLHLARFRFAMSAFHLEAFSLYAREVERFVPESMRGRVDHVAVTYVRTIRLSDCLDAYDGRTLSREQETAYRRLAVADAPGYQGNLLSIPPADPNYRAKRSLDRVLLHLDPRLLRRATDMIQAARGVMRSYARSGWGWTTYYSDAFTFVFDPVAIPTGHRPATGDRSKPTPVTTPRGGGGSSAPGGPTTPGSGGSKPAPKPPKPKTPTEPTAPEGPSSGGGGSSSTPSGPTTPGSGG